MSKNTKPPRNQVVLAGSKVPATAHADIFSAHAGAGMENVSTKDILIPRISILQALSPQVQRNKSEYIEGAEPGQICDIGTGVLLPEPLLFLPLHYAKVWLEWYPRATKRGLAAIHLDDGILANTTPDEKRRPILPNGNYVAETAQFFGLNLSGDGQLSFIPMGSTQLKAAKKWLNLSLAEKVCDSQGRTFNPPLFYRAYELSTIAQENAEGSWFGWKIERGPQLEQIEGWQDMFQQVLRLREQIKSGEAKADMRDMDDAGGTIIDHESGAM